MCSEIMFLSSFQLCDRHLEEGEKCTGWEVSEFEEKHGDNLNSREGSMAQDTFKCLDWEYIKEVLKVL